MKKEEEEKVNMACLWIDNMKTLLLGVSVSDFENAMKGHNFTIPVGQLRTDLAKKGLDWEEVVDIDVMGMAHFKEIHKKLELQKEFTEKMHETFDDFKEFMVKKYGEEINKEEAKK